MPNFGGCSALLYGPPKIGKSTFCSGLDGAFFADLEGGLRWIDDIDKKSCVISSWRDFKAFVTRLQEKGKAKNRNDKLVRPGHVIIDTLDILWVYCTEYVCKKHGFDHPSDEQYGKGYQLLRYEFQKYLARLNTLKDVSMVLVSHSKSMEIRGRGSNRTNKVVPSIPNSAREVVMPMMDIIGYCGFDVHDDEIEEDRAVLFKPEEGLEAGDRSGKLPDAMALDYKQLDKYFGTKKKSIK